MNTDIIRAAVRPPIPAKCLTHLEAWLLRRVFITEEIDNDLGFDVCRTLNDIHERMGEVLIGVERHRAAATRPCEVARAMKELCRA
jgi:hypothetical protein